MGKKPVLRVLDRSNLKLDLTQLGFDEAGLQNVMSALEVPHGMILVTGPTGSGKNDDVIFCPSVSELTEREYRDS